MLFNLKERKQKPIKIGSVTLVMYEPSALHRCEFQKMVTLNARNMRKKAGLTNGEVVEESKLFELLAASNDDVDLGIASRKEIIYLAAACLLPGRDESLEDLIAEISTQPDSTILELSNTAMELSGLASGKS